MSCIDIDIAYQTATQPRFVGECKRVGAYDAGNPAGKPDDIQVLAELPMGIEWIRLADCEILGLVVWRWDDTQWRGVGRRPKRSGH